MVELKENTRINIKVKTEKYESEIVGFSSKITQFEYIEFLNTVKNIIEMLTDK